MRDPWKVLRDLVQSCKLRPKKRLSQNFMVDVSFLRKLVELSKVSGEDVALEIGTGLGFLTAELCEHARYVISVEVDVDLAQLAHSLLAEYSNVDVLNADFLSIAVPKVDTVVSNVPYAFTSKVLLKLVEESDKFRRAALTLQRDVVEKLTSEPGSSKYVALSAIVKTVFTIEAGPVVPSSAFYPRPEVESQMVVLSPKKEVDVDKRLLISLVYRLFSGRGRKLKTVLANLVDKGEMPSAILEALPAEMLNKRVYTISTRDIIVLVSMLKQHP